VLQHLRELPPPPRPPTCTMRKYLHGFRPMLEVCLKVRRVLQLAHRVKRMGQRINVLPVQSSSTSCGPSRLPLVSSLDAILRHNACFFSLIFA
jgi:hypothetical protein